MLFNAVRVLAIPAVLITPPTITQSQSATDRTAQPSCAVAEDDKYAYTREQPVQVGGSPVYGAARQRRYLDALRGPEGQRIQYKRAGQNSAPDGTILDAYEITYEGLDKPLTLFLDWYHYTPPKAPRGFTCGQPIGLGLPPVSPFQEMDDIRALAITQGSSRDFASIPLDSDGSTTHGVVYDGFRMIARAARAAAAAGGKLDPEKPPRELTQQGMVILAHPLPCGDRTVRPAAIDIIAANGALMPQAGPRQSSGDDIARLLPGAQVPAGSLAVTVPLNIPRPNDTIRITYAEECGTTSNQVALRMTFSPTRAIDTPQPSLPAGAPADQPVLLQALVDLDGHMQRATYVGGPAELVRAAIDAIGRWRSEPARINGAPIATGVLLQVRFATPAELR